jgi:hypothetical protein
LLDGLFAHPAWLLSFVTNSLHATATEIKMSFSATC